MAEQPTRALRSAIVCGERQFRWRAEDVSRIEGFSDAVFALTLTLLVVSTEIPRDYDGLVAALSEFVPFAATFALVGMIWHEHFLFFRRFGLRDGFCRLWNAVLLLLVLFYVYPLKFLFRWLSDLAYAAFTGGGFPEGVPPGRVHVVMQVYGLGYAAVFGVFGLLYWHAWRQRDALELDEGERLVTRASVSMFAIHVGFGLGSTALATVLPDPIGAPAAGFLYCGVGPVLGVRGARLSARMRRLHGAVGAAGSG